jgi:hypothetical protein
MSDTTPADRCRGVLVGLAGEVAAAVTGLCRALIRGDAWDAAVRRCGLAALGDGPGNSGGFAPDVLRAALYFVGTSASFAEALRRSLAFAGAANYYPVLVGAVGGARWGASSVPQTLLTHADVLPRVRAAAEALAAGWEGSGS